MVINKISLFFGITLVCISGLMYAQNPFGQAPFGAGISPEKNLQFQKEMEDFQKEFESLSPDEQNAFYQSMDDAVKKIEDMSQTPEGKALLDKLEQGTITDKELDSLINQLVQEEDAKTPPTPAAPAKTEKEKAPEKPKQVLSSKHAQAIDAINSLIAHTNSFIVKAATVPEIPSKFKRWARKKVIKIEPAQTWSSFKGDIERFVDLLSRLLERDAQTQEYYHIDELLKKESLLNGLIKIQKRISVLEPLVEEVPLLQAAAMKNNVKKAYHDTINEYHEALYILKLEQELKNLFTLFDPKAKAYRQAQEKAQLDAERSPRARGPVASGVTPLSYSGSMDRQAPASPYRQAPPPAYSPGRYTPAGSSVPRRGDASLAPQPFGRQQTRRNQKPAERKAPAKKAVEEKKEKPDKDTRKGVTTRKVISHPIAQEKDIDVAYRKMKQKFVDVADIIEADNVIAALDSKLIDASPLDISMAVETIPELSKKINFQRGVLGDLQQLHRKLKSEKSRSAAGKRITRLLEKQTELDDLSKKLDALSSKIDSVPAHKQYAYFGRTDALLEEAEGDEELESKRNMLEYAKSKINAPYSLFEINEMIKQIKRVAEKFSEPKLSFDLPKENIPETSLEEK